MKDGVSRSSRQPTDRDRRWLKRQKAMLRRVYTALRIFYRRCQFEEELILRDQEPRFRVSWKRLKEVSADPRPLLRGFPRFIHRLHRFARSESDEAVRAYHAVSKRQQLPDRTSAHQQSPEGPP